MSDYRIIQNTHATYKELCLPMRILSWFSSNRTRRNALSKKYFELIRGQIIHINFTMLHVYVYGPCICIWPMYMYMSFWKPTLVNAFQVNLLENGTRAGFLEMRKMKFSCKYRYWGYRNGDSRLQIVESIIESQPNPQIDQFQNAVDWSYNRAAQGHFSSHFGLVYHLWFPMSKLFHFLSVPNQLIRFEIEMSSICPSMLNKVDSMDL